ncbi:hypothetical protein [Bosea sp. (in: a-proteobacteria)]|uniref:hypothetical protein n=1 Tax=Bosea sp. (in: a-proteobacteria) TaxID=1871050 RepID=UPI002734A912|nr:hypothetical protein [Bosea sp. (in: a-proteobacteria)]MDP3407255.1 hypothetical protein [Bosea sp. (in: a-proteobacteria)]
MSIEISPSGLKPRPMDSAPKDHTWVRLLVDYSCVEFDARPIEDSAEPSWTIGYNGEDHTGEPGWTWMGWDWSHDRIVQTRAGVPIGWLPFHGEVAIQPDFVLLPKTPTPAEIDEMYRQMATPGPIMLVDDPLRPAIRDIAAERLRQIEAEGWSPDHDDRHFKGELARAAASYVLPARHREGGFADGVNIIKLLWPWGWDWWKPTSRRRDLVKAGALIVAEIERLDRAAAKAGAAS